MKALLLAVLVFVGPTVSAAQVITQRGFVEGDALLFLQKAPNDETRAVGDVLARDELFVAPAPWVRFGAGIDFRANSHDQVDDRWRLDYWDRGVQRPRLAVRRLSATLTRGRLTIDGGKQFVRWGKTDIVTPTDRFAPRDFVNVVDSDLLAITAVRGSVAAGSETFEAVWEPRLTPSRLPLPDQRWAAVSPIAGGSQTAATPASNAVAVVDAEAPLPAGGSAGVRWSHVGEGIEYSLSAFDGLDHLPVIQSSVVLAPSVVSIARLYPRLRVYGGDLALPTRWVTIKAESAYVTSPSPVSDEYVQYVVQLERQTGEWMLTGGYAGEHVTNRRSPVVFAPDRGLSRALVARASYTIDANRSAAFEGALRQNGRGVYVKAEYSQAHGQHWRTTVAGVAIGGQPDDFLGQYRRNSYATLTLRYSF